MLSQVELGLGFDNKVLNENKQELNRTSLHTIKLVGLCCACETVRCQFCQLTKTTFDF